MFGCDLISKTGSEPCLKLVKTLDFGLPVICISDPYFGRKGIHSWQKMCCELSVKGCSSQTNLHQPRSEIQRARWKEAIAFTGKGTHICRSVYIGQDPVPKGPAHQFYMVGPRNRLQFRNTVYIKLFFVFISLWPLRSILWCKGAVQNGLTVTVRAQSKTVHQ